jgi:N-glycosylase/DNA lyase
MSDTKFPSYLVKKYKELKPAILKRIDEYSAVPEEEYFYELCFCICTPQSKAVNAYQVQKKLIEMDFYNKPFDPTELLRHPAHYIRFHNQKASRLFAARIRYKETRQMLKTDMPDIKKRAWLVRNIDGFGMKEASHFLRNIGYRNLAILDRHILKHLMMCNIFEEIPKIGSIKKYLEIEALFKKLSREVDIPLDELDLLFWSYETGEIFK